MRERLELSTGWLLAYSLGSLSTGIFSTVPTVLLLFYCTNILAIPAAIAAAIVFVPKALALIWDPVIGHRSDRTATAWGRRAPFLAIGAIAVPLAFALLFNVPIGAKDATPVVIAIAYLLLAISYSVFAVPYVAIPAEASEVPAERERLVSWRMTFSLVGVLIGSGVAPFLVAAGGGGRGGYGRMAVIVAVACCFGMTASAWAAARLPNGGARDAFATSPASLRRVFADTAFVRLALSYVLLLAAAATLSSATPYLVADALHRPDRDTGTLLGALLVASIAAMAGWAAFLRRRDPYVALAFAGIGFVVLSVPVALLNGGTPIALAVLAYAAIGVPFAGLQLVPFALAAHAIHRASRRSGASEGLYTGVWTACEKIGLALGPAMVGLALAKGGTGHAIEAVRLVVIVTPLAFVAIGLMSARGATERAG